MNCYSKIKSNILPIDGIVYYHGIIMSKEEADKYLELLLKNILWENDEIVIFGNHIVTKRKVAWYGTSDYLYNYSNSTKKALKWTKELITLKRIVEKLTKQNFNSCLLNLYHNGNEGIGWHSDDEKNLGKINTIASLSFGAERKFFFQA